MRWLFIALIVLHGVIHVMGFAKAFGLADLPQLTTSVSAGMGIAWLVSACLFITSALLLAARHRAWWVSGLAAVVLSQAVIATAWSDAKAGSIANALVLVGVVYGFASQGPFSLRAGCRQEVRTRLTRFTQAPRITAEDLTALPEPVRRYVRLAGAVGQPRVSRFRATWRGRIRANPDEAWMAFTAEQYNFLDEPARFFFMDATRGGLPVDVFHAFRGGAASMRVRLLSLIPLVTASGPELTRAETVTLFNDVCLLAPAALVDPAIHWDPIDERSARGHYTAGPNTIRAVLSFNDEGELVNFTSEDRLAQSAGGTRWTRQSWSTPVGEYRQFGPWRVSTRGEGRWHPPDGAFSYIELELLELQTNEEVRQP
jgi:Family of unknown function (DUF6544)